MLSGLCAVKRRMMTLIPLRRPSVLLELWHAKTRGRQAYWDGQAMQGMDFVEMSKLHMDYKHSAVQALTRPRPKETVNCSITKVQ